MISCSDVGWKAIAVGWLGRFGRVQTSYKLATKTIHNSSLSSHRTTSQSCK